MTKKIESLTPDQWAALHAFREEVRQRALRSGPSDVETARPVIEKMYAALGKPPPAVMRFSSPLMCLLAREALLRLLPDRAMEGDQLRDQLGGQLGGQLRDQLGGQLGGQLGDQLWGQLGDQLRDQLWGQLGGQLGDQLRDQLGDQLGGQLGGQLGDQLWDQLRDQLGDQLRGQLRDQLWGQLGDQLGDQLGGQLGDALWGACEADWTAFYEAGALAGAAYTAEQTERLAWWTTLRDTCFWWWPYNEVVLVSDRPVSCWDERYRLHNPGGPAIRFSDGYEVYAWHGVRVPREVVMEPESFSAEQVRALNNSEAIRALGERLGWDKLLAAMGAKSLDTWHDSQTGLDYELLDIEPRLGEAQPRWLRMVSPTQLDGTRPQYIETVHPKAASARAARRWQFRNADGTWPSIDDANARPTLTFNLET